MSDKTRIGRLPERSVEDRNVLNEIIDQALICHVGYVAEDRPVVIPTLVARDNDRILLHGSNTAGYVKAARRGRPLCVTVTHMDGIVVARSGFHSSANYRSAVIHGTGRVLADDEHREALELTIERLIPGRLADVRDSTPAELGQTAVVELALDEWSVKARSGGPGDDEEDLHSDTWAGVIPLAVVAGKAIPSEDLADHIPLPDYLNPYTR